MPEVLKLPKLFKSMTGAIVTEWYVGAGDKMEAGKPLCEVSTHKVSIDIDCPTDGILLLKFAKIGDFVPLDGQLAVYGEEGEKVSQDILDNAPSYSPAPQYQACETIDQSIGEIEPLSPMREILGKRMSYSKQNAPHWFVTTTVDMTACLELRKKLKADKIRATYNDMIIKACALALKKFPRVASLFTAKGYLNPERINVGFAAVLGEEGLVVPVVRDADGTSLQEISLTTKEYIKKARDKKLTPDDYGDGVFTVSNLGTFDVDSFIAIINPPESAILAVGKIADTPVAIKGEVHIRPIMKITLSCDHRVIDGVMAAKFNGAVKSLLEVPEQLI